MKAVALCAMKPLEKGHILRMAGKLLGMPKSLVTLERVGERSPSLHALVANTQEIIIASDQEAQDFRDLLDADAGNPKVILVVGETACSHLSLIPRYFLEQELFGREAWYAPHVLKPGWWNMGGNRGQVSKFLVELSRRILDDE